jgi:hypothetical protein
MAPPSKLKIATGVLSRLVKEEASYHKELVHQEARIKKIQADTEDENAEYQLKQEVGSPCPKHPHILNHSSDKHWRRPRTCSQVYGPRSRKHFRT